MNSCQICRCPIKDGARTYRLGLEGDIRTACHYCKSSFLHWLRSSEENGLDNLRRG
jgi:hypothetical protein